MSYGYRYPTEAGGASLASIVTFVHPYWAGLKRFWWIPAICAALAAGGMMLMIRNQPPPAYVSTARIWIGLRSADPNGGRALGDADGTQLEIMNSPDLRTRAENATQARYPNLRVSPVRLSAGKVKESSIFQLQASGVDPEYTRRFLEEFIQTYVQYLRESFITDAASMETVVRNKLDEVSRELKEATRKLDDFKQENSVELLRQRSLSSTTIHTELQKKQHDLQMELDRLNLFSVEQILDQEQRGLPTATMPLVQPGTDSLSGAADLTDNPEARARLAAMDPLNSIYNTRHEIEMMRFQQQELGKDLREKHPKMIALADAIARAQKNLESLVKQSEDKIAQRKQAIVLEMRALEKPLKDAEDDALAFSKKTAEFDALVKAVADLTPMYEKLLTGAESINMRQSMTDYIMKVLEPPSAARARAVNNVTKMVVGVGVGLVLGIGIVGLIVFFDDRVKSLTALKAAFQEPVIGQVPNVGDGSEENQKIDLLKEDDDRHNFAESFRNIRSSILFMDAGETRPKTIVITSAIPSEGKSSVAANLAKTMAMSGSKVLLVDGDQRRCSINEKMGLPVGPGFSDVLTGKMKFEEAVLNPEPNLSVLVRGTTIKNPGELFVGSAADNFLRSVYDKFDYILIDTPPVLAADDVTSLAPKVDGVVFVIRAEHTSARLAKQSLELLYNRHVRVLGLIYNRANLFLPEYSYYKYSSYYNQPQEKDA